jgi:TolB-like protein
MLWIEPRSCTQDARQLTSLVVLPLTNLSGDPSQDYFADGMTDELTTDLARISSLKVISETSAVHYRGTHPPLQQIAEELDVDAVIEGSVARSGDHVRITAQLIDVKNDRHLWAQSYDRHGIDVLGLQRDVALSITNQIHLKLTPAEASRLETLPTHNQQAYDAYLHAKYHVYSAFAVEADTNAAIAEAEQAVTLDPDFAEAYVVIAQGCFAKIFDWAGGKQHDEKAFVALGRAIALNPALAEAYAARGSLYYTRLHNFDVVSAVADYRRAISLNPNLAEAHHNLGAELTHVGLHDQAIEEFRTTLRLDPQNDGAKYRLGRALWQSQRFEEALQNYDRYNIVSFEKALTLTYLGRRQQAWETIEGVAQQLGRARRGGFLGDPEDVAAVRAFLYATEAKPQKAEREIQVAARLGKDNDHFHHAAFILAAACAEMGKPHEAVAWLSRVAGTGMPNYPLFRDNPGMSKLRGNSEFEEFMARLKPRWDQLAASL